jgi:hypothetical protein
MQSVALNTPIASVLFLNDHVIAVGSGTKISFYNLYQEDALLSPVPVFDYERIHGLVHCSTSASKKWTRLIAFGGKSFAQIELQWNHTTNDLTAWWVLKFFCILVLFSQHIFIFCEK